MIPYAGQGGIHNTPTGKKVLFYIFGSVCLLLGLGAGIFDGQWSWGAFAGAAAFFFIGWMQGKFPG